MRKDGSAALPTRLRLWLAPGMGVKRFVFIAILGVLVTAAGVVAGALWLLADARAAIATPVESVLVSRDWRRFGGWASLLAVLVGLGTGMAAITALNRSLLSNWMPRPRDAAVVLHQRLLRSRGPRIVAFGGGTGLSNLLRGLRDGTSNLTAVVTVADDGGSSGRLRAAFGMPAPGDLSDCLAALSDDEQQVGRLMQYRFERGDAFKGHTFGNMLITTVSEVEGDILRATRALNRMLDISGAVWPVTASAVTLTAEKASGVRVEGESRIASVPGRVDRLRLEPQDVPAAPEVTEAVTSADLIVLGPGSLFTSVVAPLLVPGVGSALREASAPIVFVCNIMTEAGETDGMDAAEHVTAIHTHLGRWPDIVIVNDVPVDAPRRDAYRGEDAEEVRIDRSALALLGLHVEAAPLLAEGRYAQHDSVRLADVVLDVAQRVRRGERFA